ncbi:MAG: hypothetical protein II578_02795, partial [Bacteroidaceae bacterium]|nr:hypothetical protein [Bacteroidaceae bacterium]
EEAMKLGFNVSVKQIPVGKEKQDPDTFCKNRTLFDRLEEQDFILWMADLLFEDGMIDAEKGKVIRQLSSLMATMEDDTTMEMYIAKLTQYVGTKTMWKKEVDKQRKLAAEEEEKAKAEKESALYKQFGFIATFAAGRATYALGSHGGSAALSFGRGSCSPVDTRTQTATIGSETFALSAFIVLRAIAISARAPAAVGEFLAPAFVFDTHVFLILGFDDVCFSLVSLFFILNTCICLRRDGSQLGFHVFADV